MSYDDYVNYYDGNRYMDTDAVDRAFKGTAGYKGRYSDFVTIGADGAQYVDTAKLNYEVDKARTEQRAFEGFLRMMSDKTPSSGNGWVDIDKKPYLVADGNGTIHPMHLVHNKKCQLNKDTQRFSGFSSQEQLYNFIISNMKKRPSIFCPVCCGEVQGMEELYDSLSYTIKNGKPRISIPRIKLLNPKQSTTQYKMQQKPVLAPKKDIIEDNRTRLPATPKQTGTLFAKAESTPKPNRVPEPEPTSKSIPESSREAIIKTTPETTPEFDTKQIRILSIAINKLDNPKIKNTTLGFSVGVQIDERPPADAIFTCKGYLIDSAGKKAKKLAYCEGKLDFHVHDEDKGIYVVNMLFDFGDEVKKGTYLPSVDIGQAKPDPKCKMHPMFLKKTFRLFG